MDLEGSDPQRVWRGASATKPNHRALENGMFIDSAAPLHYNIVHNKWASDAGPDSLDVGRWDEELNEAEKMEEQGTFVALGGNRARPWWSTELLDFKNGTRTLQRGGGSRKRRRASGKCLHRKSTSVLSLGVSWVERADASVWTRNT